MTIYNTDKNLKPDIACWTILQKTWNNKYLCPQSTLCKLFILTILCSRKYILWLKDLRFLLKVFIQGILWMELGSWLSKNWKERLCPLWKRRPVSRSNSILGKLRAGAEPKFGFFVDLLFIIENKCLERFWLLVFGS